MRKATFVMFLFMVTWGTCGGSPFRYVTFNQQGEKDIKELGCGGSISSNDTSSGTSYKMDASVKPLPEAGTVVKHDVGPIRDTMLPPTPKPDSAIPTPKPDTSLPAPKPDSAIPTPKPDTSPPAPKPDLAIPTPKPDTSLPAPKPDLAIPTPKPDTSPPPPPSTDPLPTWVNLDWAAFPVDPGPNYQVQGRTWVVKISGNDNNQGTEDSPLRTIANALQKAQSGDMVKVGAGTYAELFPNHWCALVMSRDGVILTNAPGEKVTVVPTSGYRCGLVLQGSHIVVNGINLKGFTPSIEFGLDNTTQRDVVITNLTAEAATDQSFTDGIVDYADTNSKGFPSIDGLLLKNVSMLGASLSISCNAGLCKSWRLVNVTVSGTGGSGSGADAIAVENGDNMLFENVDVSNAAADGIDMKATRVVVWGSHVHNIQRNGIKLWNGGDIVNSLIHHVGADAAIVMKGNSRGRILHSTIAYHNKDSYTSYNMTFGYDNHETIQVEIIDSIIYNTSGGTYVSPNGTISIQNSLFYGIDNGMLLEYGNISIQLANGAAAIAANGLGDGNIIADPRLDSTFHQQTGSPVINSGKVLGSYYPTTDMDGDPRVKGGSPDLGPFEEF